MNTLTVFVSSNVGITQINRDISIEVYPNPVGNVVTLRSSKPMEQILIVDAVGKLVLKTTVLNRQEIIIDMSDVNPGIYMAIIKHRNGKYISHRLVKH